MTATSAEDVWRTLRRYFRNASHEPWFKDLVRLPWARIWTLNIDDTVENAYVKENSATARPIRTVAWDDEYSETGDLDVIHLHGHVLGHEPSRLVFSMTEYVGTGAARQVWHQMLAGVLGSEPFIVMGARLLGDPDVESVLLSHPPTGTAPSLIVDPFVSEGNRWELEKLGYIVISQPGEEFVKVWRSDLELTDQAITTLREARELSVPQLHRLVTNRVEPPPRSHDFLGGDPPTWRDVVLRTPVDLSTSSELITQLGNWMSSEHRSARLIIQYAPRLTGLSTVLLTVARSAIAMGAHVFQFDRSSRWDSHLLVELARQFPTVVVIDGGADFGDDIDRSLRLAEESGTQLLFLCGEVLGNELRLEERLTGTYGKSTFVAKKGLGNKDSTALYEKLRSSGRLGSLELIDRRAALAVFKGRDIFSAMLDVEYGLGFRKRLDTEVTNLKADWQHELVLLLALASQGQRTVTSADAAIALGVASDAIVAALTDDSGLQALVQLNGSVLISRQRDRSLASLLRVLPPRDALASILRIIKRVAPAASREGMRERNRLPLLMSHLMTYKTLSAAFPNEDFDDFYKALITVFGDWSGRYWEQRAIHAKAIHDWGRAESFAGRAVNLYDDSYTRTTYGTILMNRSRLFVSEADPKWLEYYRRALDQFTEAHIQSPGNRITLFASLDSSLAVLEAATQSNGSDDVVVRKMVDEWSETYTLLRLGLVDEEGLQSVKRAEQLSSRFQKLIERTVVKGENSAEPQDGR
ncbi:SIR2 family protein [Tessaracoccus sp. SD287]|nr:SIR2 family protein [Tessaracoccus sp. SD287]